MKKILIALVMLLSVTSVFAYGKDDSEFTWADYEMICSQYDIEPSYEQYIELVNNPQCIIIEE